MEEMREKRCPRCGGLYSYVKRERRGDRVYLYAVHYESGKARKCYLGPDGGYVHAEHVLGLELKGLSSLDLSEIAVNAILRLRRTSRDKLGRVVEVLLSCLDTAGKARLVEKAIERVVGDGSLSLDDRISLVKRFGEVSKMALETLSSLKVEGMKRDGETA